MQYVLVFLLGIGVLSFLTISAHAQPVSNETNMEISKETCLEINTMCSAVCTSCVINNNEQHCNTCVSNCGAYDKMCSAHCNTCANNFATHTSCGVCEQCNVRQ
jgi:hypothetical protein